MGHARKVPGTVKAHVANPVAEVPAFVVTLAKVSPDPPLLWVVVRLRYELFPNRLGDGKELDSSLTL